jgi:hypothetical protein
MNKIKVNHPWKTLQELFINQNKYIKWILQ